MLQGEYYRFGNYLSPVYSPELWGPSPHFDPLSGLVNLVFGRPKG